MNKTRASLLILMLLCLHLNAQKLIQQTTSLKSIATVWDLDKANKQGTFKITAYKPIYFTASRWSDTPNKLPYSENSDYSVTEEIDYNSLEAKFQLSFKTKLAESILFGKGDLWATYTQIAHWQIYNTDISRAFRELNYEPELIITYPLNLTVAGFNIKMASVSLNHQSNGRDLPRSRSWNRIIFNIAMESKNLTLYLTPWLRLPDDEDENPLITDFIGNGRLTAIYKLKKHTFYTVLTNTFTVKDNRGSLQFNYLYPLNENLNLHAQLFTGYGETLVDYNHYQNTVGLGVSFSNW
ncbi:phospholipase A [Winogradskyella endarachnes]|uniref:Phosphatidylcholine 1-acylhydrolase n=1 Tax=Winogradskyella endarachnes TaxID=2681965 RepID=A0A6L6U9D2_9FLAO|nr:phospholipase A [Winogradskyella endarachnes]MUU77537.1 phospholipase [Winogradskyella endarachnes]